MSDLRRWASFDVCRVCSTSNALTFYVADLGTNSAANQGDKQGPFRGGNEYLSTSIRFDQSTSDGTAEARAILLGQTEVYFRRPHLCLWLLRCRISISRVLEDTSDAFWTFPCFYSHRQRCHVLASHSSRPVVVPFPRVLHVLHSAYIRHAFRCRCQLLRYPWPTSRRPLRVRSHLWPRRATEGRRRAQLVP